MQVRYGPRRSPLARSRQTVTWWEAGAARGVASQSAEDKLQSTGGALEALKLALAEEEDEEEEEEEEEEAEALEVNVSSEPETSSTTSGGTGNNEMHCGSMKSEPSTRGE